MQRPLVGKERSQWRTTKSNDLDLFVSFCHRGEGADPCCFRARRLYNPLTCTAFSPSSMNRPIPSLKDWFFVEIPPFFLDGEWSATSDGEPAVSFQPSRARKAQGLDGLSAKSKSCGITMRPCSNSFS